MKLSITFVVFVTVMLVSGNNSYSQEKPKQPKPKHHSYHPAVKLDSAKAEQVRLIHERYKADMKKVSGLGQGLEERRIKVRALIEEKNRKLSRLLTIEEQRKVIPSAENK